MLEEHIVNLRPNFLFHKENCWTDDLQESIFLDSVGLMHHSTNKAEAM